MAAQPKQRRPGAMSAYGLTTLLVGLVPPGFCLYLWWDRSSIDLGDPRWNLALALSLLFSPFAIVGALSSEIELVDEPLTLEEAPRWRQHLLQWWSFFLLLPVPVLGVAGILATAGRVLADPGWASGVSGGSAALSWLLLLAMLFLMDTVRTMRSSVALTEEGLRTGLTTTLDWESIESFRATDHTVWIYTRGHRGVPYEGHLLEPVGFELLCEELEARGVKRRAHEPPAFRLFRLATLVLGLALLGAGLWLWLGLALDVRGVAVGVLVVSVVCTYGFERLRGVSAAYVAPLTVETEDEHWRRVRSELSSLFEEWSRGERTREQVLEWTRELLEEHWEMRWPSQRDSSHELVAGLLELTRRQDTPIRWADAARLADIFGSAPGEEGAVIKRWISDEDTRPAPAREVIADILFRWQSHDLDTAEADEALLAVVRDSSLGPFDDDDARSIAAGAIARVFPLSSGQVFRDDVPIVLDFLETARGEEREAWARWTRHWLDIDRVDRLARREMQPTERQRPPVSRKKLRRLLERWQRGQIDTGRLREWAHDVRSPMYMPDCALDDPAIIETSVLACLQTLDVELLTPDDVPALLAMLDAEPGSEAEALRAWFRHVSGIDYAARIEALHESSTYVTYPARQVLERLGATDL